jgi:methylase of polypeptide subunit release factors
METSLEEIDISKLVEEIKKRAQSSSNEEELRIGFAIVFDPILQSWNIKPAYEKHSSGVRCVVSGVRKDALYGTVIIEFKAPGKLHSLREFEKAKNQVKKYIEDECSIGKEYGRYFGVVTDGFQIAFVRFRKGKWEETEALDINSQTILRLLEAIRGLKRKPLDVELLLEDFGPKSDISQSSILALYNALLKSRSPRTKILFEDWKRVFSQVCAYSKEKLSGLVDYYNLKNQNIDVEKLMFSIHTYYTILMKLLTSEIVSLYSDSLITSYLKSLEEAYLKDKKELLNQLKEIEEGGIFRKLGIKNFLEADYFAWYTDEWNNSIADTIYKVTERLLDYEPATIELSPEKVKDLFKRLYQNLVPREIRHSLGEYFTPDWLAELLLDEVGYDGNPEKRVLDPACGSGTFLVLVIKRIKEYAEEHFIDKRTLISKIVNNVQGIDLNPLAVLAAKANYIIALADLLRYKPKGGIDIPIYLADSIAVGRSSHLFREEVYLKTTVGEFKIPTEVVEKGILSKILDDIELCINNKCSKDDFKKVIQKYELEEESFTSLIELYSKLLSLEKEGRNKIWTRILKNSFAPLLMGKFDYVVGNPPWINWEYLPEFYRNETKQLWDNYGLLKKTKGVGLGKVKRDMAMLFVARCLDRFTKDGGKLSFLIPFTVYKTQAGAGFREFLAIGRIKNEKEELPCKILKVHDLVTLYPFEGAVNRTSLIVTEKSFKTQFPIPCVLWYNPKSTGIPQEDELDEVKKVTKQFDMILLPIEENKPETPWMEITDKAYVGIKKIIGSSPWYEAYEGVNTALNQIYWIKIISKLPDGDLLITNLPLSGQKKSIKTLKQTVEKNLVYPLVRGRGIKKWYVSKDYRWVIIPHDPKTGKPIKEGEMKLNFPNTYDYFNKFRKELENRSIHRLWGKGKPFYSVYDIGNYTFYPYKVIWKRISGAITGKAINFSSAVLEPADTEFLGKRPVIVNDSVILIPFENSEEAYYVAGVLNSSIALLAIASYTYELRQETHITHYIRIPKFDPKNSIHQKISQLSKKAHEIARKMYERNREDLKEELNKIEDEIDKNVAEIYSITDEELEEIKKCLKIFKEGEISEEENEKEEEIILPKGEEIKISIEPLIVNENESKELVLKISNNLNVILEDGEVKIMLKDKALTDQEIKNIKKDEEKILMFKLPKLNSGKYNLEVIFTFKINNKINSIKEMKTLFVKPSNKKERKSHIEGLDELLGG